MRSSRTQNRPTLWGFPYREKPRLQHLIIGLTVSLFSFAGLWFGFRQLFAELVARILSSSGIQAEVKLSSDLPVLAIELLDGSKLNLVLTSQRSGLISIAIFALLFVFVLFPLKGSLLSKIAWLECGFIIGLTWSVIRLCIGAMLGYHFGQGAFTVAEFLISPFTDFFWVVSVWSLGLSTLIPTKRRKVR